MSAPESAFYTGGDANHVSQSQSGATSLPSSGGATQEFRNAFRHFLLHFSTNVGENIYREQIRNLDLCQSDKIEEIAEAQSKGIPAIRLDLEHLNMTHWIPNHNQTSTQSQPSTQNDEDDMSQISEEDSAQPNTASRWCEILTNAFRSQPLQYLPAAEQVIREVFVELQPSKGGEGGSEIQTQDSNKFRLFQLELISRTKPMKIRDLGASAVESLIVLSGIVIQAYMPEHKAVKVFTQCRQCDSSDTLVVPLWRQGVQLPRMCKKGATGAGEEACPMDPYIILSDKSEFCDVQRIKIQELPEHVPTGDMPRNLMLNAPNSLCGRVVPGERIIAVGVYSVGAKGSGVKDVDAVRTPYIHVLGLDYSEVTGSRKHTTWTFKQEEEFQAMARDPLIHEKIFRSIAPSLIGLEDIKKSVACMLFGGSRKCLPDGTRLRGDINILLLGDPSTAKSQFLKFVEKAAPISVYTSGKGSSAAGLTAAVVRDVHGNFALEGGAMVLADGGVVCIDEFDKMRDNDRVAIHEAMEQQTISMAKAGITTVLTTRCSVLAAANPSFGSYDDSKDTTEQHDFETTILSRFDLIWLVRDEKSVERDQIIARHIYNLHCGGGHAADSDAPIGAQKLKDFTHYCRSVCSPVLSDEASKKLENYYVEVREGVRSDTRRRRDQIPITIRQLESLARISESLAKMALSRTVTEQHVEEAIRLFKLSTVEAAKTSIARENLTDLEREQVKAAESLILSRLPLNARASKASVLRDLKVRGIETIYTGRALRALIQRGLLEERGDASVRRVAGN